MLIDLLSLLRKNDAESNSPHEPDKKSALVNCRSALCRDRALSRARRHVAVVFAEKQQ